MVYGPIPVDKANPPNEMVYGIGIGNIEIFLAIQDHYYVVNYCIQTSKSDMKFTIHIGTRRFIRPCI